MTDSSHYLVFLGLGLLIYFFCTLQKLPPKMFGFEKYAAGIGILLSFFISLKWQLSGFILSSALTFSLILSLNAPIHAVCVTLFLYICRPWEVIQAEEWWLQVPRWCIWLWLLSWLIHKPKHETAQHPLLPITFGFALMFALGFWALATTLISGDPAQSRQFFVDTLFRAMVLLLIIGLTVKSSKDVKRLCLAFGVGVSTLSIFSLWRFLGHDQPLELPFIDHQNKVSDRRLEAVGSLGNSNDIAAVVMIPLGFLWPMLFSIKSTLSIRLFAAVASFFLLKTILASQSRGALIAGVAQCALYFVSRSKRPGLLGGALLIIVALCAPLANRVMGRDADDLDASTESRMNYYITGLRMALYSPIWGQGFGRYPYEFERYSTATLHEWGLRTAHSSWVLVLSETGFVGLGIFAAIHYRMFKICWTLRSEYPGLLLALAGYSITILFLSHSWLMFPWILFALIEFAKFTHDTEANHVGSQKRVPS